MPSNSPGLLEPGSGLCVALLASLAALIVWAVWRDRKNTGQTLSHYFAFRAMWLLCKLWHGVRPRGPDPLPRRGAAILISNHTSAADPLFLQCGSRRVITFLMAREYYSLAVLQPIFRSLANTILVNRTGRDTAATKATLRALGEGQVVAIFPEGGIHLDPGTVGEGKPGAAMLALLARVPVIPAFIDRPLHTNRLWEGMFRPAPTRVFYGQPIDLSRYYARRHDRAVLEEVTVLLMQSIDELRPAPVPPGIKKGLKSVGPP